MYDIYKPKSKILRQYISEFTILKKEIFKPINYVAFPHSVSSIVFLSGAKIKHNDSQIVVKNGNNNAASVVAIGKYLKPLYLHYQNPVDEIGIIFTPTGLNYFFKDNFYNIAREPFQFLSKDIWNDFSTKLFNHKESERIDLLENFLLSQLQHKELKQIEQIVDIVTNDLSIRIKEIALTLNISERTISRLFRTYIGCSPSAFKKILRFRNSVVMNNQKMSLTELCLSNAYYDSPHFTNEFKKLTSKSPKTFFNHLTEVGDKTFPYIFI